MCMWRQLKAPADSRRDSKCQNITGKKKLLKEEAHFTNATIHSA